MTTAKGSAVIQVRGLERRFGDLVAVAGIDLKVRAGEIFGVLGPNGAGKSTTIRMLCGLLAPSAGSGTVLGIDLLKGTQAIKRRIGYMSQASSLYSDLSVSENLRFNAGIHGLGFGGGAAEVQSQIERFGLGERRNQVVATLSGGWKQRVALACATIHKPDLLFLDEPTAGVDPVSRREFWQLIGVIARAGTTVLVTTHYMDEAERFDRLAFVFRGKQLDVGTPAELIARSGLHVLELTEDGAAEHAARLTSNPAVVEAAMLGRSLRLVARGDKALALLPGATPGRVTVEDAFIDLARRSERA
ncbi:MAG TPA: ABC transporter ATP-binding protein [Planctomycetota bacterium]|nr:ABC transporter ATP-binding protein [Planctomycetota bacterium]